MTIKVKVYSDYVCPFCFLGKDQFEKAIEGKDVEVEWMPFELRPRPYEPLDPLNDPAKLAMWESAIAPRIEAWDVNMKLPNVSPHPYTDLAHEGYHFAKEHGKAKEYNDRVYSAFFQEEQNIGDIEVLAKLAKEAGLDEKAFKDALVSRKYRKIQQQAVRHAYEEAGITAVPTFIIGSERISGAAAREVFERVIEEESGKIKTAGNLQCDVDGGSC
ncbi:MULTISPECIES: DsbA family oxidoreductase [Bacillus]|uniref:DsbA family oxidoreductase n=1 Tax=Bacillus TaxID=1386 RepID=UPI0015822327|nr:DsbA family oxidoreductase [Bacillus glycinifermentans]MBU8785792.1 DsbA family protein [Bacillus glycinifermentans]NUJ15671.1 DsbA family oxidoreductase [Bacillus glycinifermentans]